MIKIFKLECFLFLKIETLKNARSICNRILLTLQLWDLIVTTVEYESATPKL